MDGQINRTDRQTAIQLTGRMARQSDGKTPLQLDGRTDRRGNTVEMNR